MLEALTWVIGNIVHITFPVKIRAANSVLVIAFN